MNGLWQDVRYGLRMLAKNPGFTAVGTLTLALSIGANTGIFSILRQVLLQSLPVPRPEELVLLYAPGPKQGYVSSDEASKPGVTRPVGIGILLGLPLAYGLGRLVSSLLYGVKPFAWR